MRILILGGAQEAFQLAEQLAEAEGVEVVSSLAGRTLAPRLPKGEVRTGGFGGVEGLARYLHEKRISHLVNATHPFAERISANAIDAAQSAGIPMMRLLRPAWVAHPDDRWIAARDAAEAAALCRQQGGRILLTLGSGEIDAFADIHNVHFLVRMVDVPERLPLRNYLTIAARGPFTLQDELRLLIDRHIGSLVAKNSGGDATYAKIEAARRLGLPVIMIERPPIALNPQLTVVKSVADALAWVREMHG